MNQRVAVEQGLSQVSQYLRQQGCDVVDLSANEMAASECDYCVISGGDKDMMGMQDIRSDQVVINAEGLTAEEVYQAIRQRMNRTR